MTAIPDRYPVQGPSPVSLEFEDVVLDLKRIVEAKGAGYVYRPIGAEPDEYVSGVCQYFEDGQPSCIVGHVLAAHGVQAAQSDYWNRIGVLGLDDDVVSVFTADLRTKRLLWFTQRFQDEGVPWGDALELALENFEDANGTDPAYIIRKYKDERKTA